jgi:hypothetical protein
MPDTVPMCYDPDPRRAGPYDPDPRRAFVQWRAEYDLWRLDLSIWELHWQWLLRQQDDRKVYGDFPTLMAFAQMLVEAKQERRALRAKRPKAPPCPEHCRGLTCGARARAGTPCQRRDLGAGARCRLHGGRSTGPQTAAGKRRSALNGLQPKRKRTP